MWNKILLSLIDALQADTKRTLDCLRKRLQGEVFLVRIEPRHAPVPVRVGQVCGPMYNQALTRKKAFRQKFRNNG